jgi:LysR family transcriptional activator of nhaA
MYWMNYNHLYYFWVIASEGSITKASQRLRLSQSALSEQLKQFEIAMGSQLFDRKNRQLRLTESGQLALEYANTIFAMGQELLDIFKHRPVEKRHSVVRIGAISSLSKNLQYEFLRPLLTVPEVKLVVTQAPLSSLIRQLQNHLLDVVISNMSVRTDQDKEVYNYTLAEMTVCVVGVPRFQPLADNFPHTLSKVPIYVPTDHSNVRAELEIFAQQGRVKLQIQAEVEDMALLRLLALSGEGLVVVPQIVVKNELETGQLMIIKSLPQVMETFYAITPNRKTPNPFVEKMISQFMQTKASWGG